MTAKNHFSLDLCQQKLFISYFRNLPEKPSTTIRFFNRTDYYTVHGNDAKFAAKEVFRTEAFIKTIGSDSDSLDSLILNKSQFESLIRDLLLVKQYKVEVYTNKGNKNPNSWTLEYKGSPGNLNQFEEILFSGVDQLEGNSTISLKYDPKNKVTGIALIDIIESQFLVAEIPDDEHFANMEGVIIQFGPKECIIPNESTPEAAALKKIAERCGVLVTMRKKSDFNSDGLVQDLNRLIKFNEGQQQSANVIPQMEFSNAMSALAAGLKYLELCADEDNFGKFDINTLDHGRFVHLDSAAVYALSILGNESTPSNNFSITSLLDKCRTTHGHRLLQQWIKQPLRDINIISDRHDIVEFLVNDTVLRQALYEDHLKKFPDLQALSKKLARKKATMQDCYRIYQAVERVPPLISLLKEYKENKNYHTLRDMIVSPFEEYNADMEMYKEMIVTTIDLNLVDRGEFLVKPEFDDNLEALHSQITKLEKKLKEEMNKVAQDLSLDAKAVKLESNNQYGYFFRITLKDEKALRKKSAYSVLDTNKNGVRFRNARLGEMNDEYLTLRNDYEEHQQVVVDGIISTAVGYASTINKLSFTLAQLDVLCSFAVVAACAPKPYVRPVMKPAGSGILNMSQVRHPCLEMLDNMSFIANDANFNKDSSLFYIITGPNMGGKSTYIRSIGVAALLAHIGSFVPCDEAEISILDAILARVGASDSQFKGMSTFMVEMVEAASILKMATGNSLVIIDELGRGTSTYEGCGIAWAIAEFLAKEVKPFCLFATHFHELTRLSDEIKEVENLHVTAVTSEDSLTLLYQVKQGACDQSFGIHVANMAKIPPRVINDAKRKLSELEDFQSLIKSEDDVKKRKIVQDGEAVIKTVLDQIKNEHLENLSDDELKLKIENLREEIMSKKNTYLEILTKKPIECFP
ncbi:DNA mismatch repair protein Msh2-like [Cimex lectularius]|uniref:DNA mismatch repair protein MSH2 n=1 Tax=Cimex lectularius TaxID=79782 RepID=A0A8I6RP37_CIMLE|nr:DNA mismatch repair protein Msh2-like [Cimex lectularius]